MVTKTPAEQAFLVAKMAEFDAQIEEIKKGLLLLFNSDNPEYQKLRDGILRYIIFLRDAVIDNRVTSDLERAWFMFPEVRQNWLVNRSGGVLLMATMFGLYPFLLKLYADGGYQGAGFQSALQTVLSRVNVEIVKRSDQPARFVVLPKRWIVERTFAWLGRCRRLAKDWECLNRKALAFLKLASIRLMLRKLCNPK